MAYREILFRGKRIDNDEWVKGFLSKGRYYGYKGNSLQPAIEYEEKGVMCVSVIKPETVGQYTGIVDRCGRLVFEGDVVKLAIGFVGFIEWQEDEGRFLISCGDAFETLDGATYDVIGNIYDNPELVGQGG